MVVVFNTYSVVVSDERIQIAIDRLNRRWFDKKLCRWKQCELIRIF